MKKLLALFTFVLLLGVGFASSVQAEGEIELYPYDKIECLEALDTCNRTKVGDSHWDVVFNGYNYNVVGGNARYAVDFDDANLDGYIDATEMPANSWSSFGGIIVNDTGSEVILKTANRTDLTGAVQRIYTYFDENGKLAMFEDHYVTKYYIFNDGTAEAPDWRLATQAEADAYDAADPKPDTTMYTTIRMALDDVDSDGYVIEPLASLAWHAQGVDTGVDPVEDWSAIIDGDPNYVTIPAGWTVFGFGSLDRDGSNAKTLDFIKTLPEALAAESEMMTLTYDPQPGYFTGLTALDDDAVTPGINIVVDYNGSFDLSNAVEAKWLDMFDDSDLIQNSVEMLDYSVEISDDSGVLQTVDFTWDGTDYTPSAAVNVIDSSMFGKGYMAVYSVSTPEGDVTEVELDIVVGVMPPRFAGVEDRYATEDMMIDLLGDITADDGYGNDKTDSIMISYPESLNPYYPQPGEYQIDLTFTHKFVFEAPDSTVTIDGVTSVWDEASYNTITSHGDATTNYAIFTDSTMAQNVTWAWGSVMVLVGSDGLVDAIYDRYTWDVDDETGAWNDGGASFETWKSSIDIEPGGFVIFSHGSTISPPLRALAYDSPVSFDHTGLDTITINGATIEWDRSFLNSITAHGDATNQYAIFTDSTMAQEVSWAWGSVMVLVGADGLVDAVYDRYTWDVTDETGEWNDGGTTFTTWKDSLAIEDGGFVVLSHGSNISPPLRALAYDDPMAYDFGEVDLDIDIVTDASYMLTVDDVTAPVALIVDDNYSIVAGEFGSVNDAILANVVAFDNYDSMDDVAMFVSNNGGLLVDTAGNYDVEVTIEDYAGNQTIVSFSVEVTEAPYTDAEIDAALAALETLTETEINALIDALDYYTEAEVDALVDGLDYYTEAEVDALLAALETLTEDEINALIDGQDLITEDDLMTEEDVQALIDDALLETGCGSSLNIGSAIIMSVIALSGVVALVLRKRF